MAYVQRLEYDRRFWRNHLYVADSGQLYLIEAELGNFTTYPVVQFAFCLIVSIFFHKNFLFDTVLPLNCKA